MKKLSFALLTGFLLSGAFPVQVRAVTKTTDLNQISALSEKARYMERINTIRGMDFANMSSLEKKTLREEVLSIKAHASNPSGGIYLSAGAIIIILIILILLF